MINSVSAEISTILTPCKENPIDDWRIFSLRKVFKEPEKSCANQLKILSIPLLPLRKIKITCHKGTSAISLSRMQKIT